GPASVRPRPASVLGPASPDAPSGAVASEPGVPSIAASCRFVSPSTVASAGGRPAPAAASLASPTFSVASGPTLFAASRGTAPSADASNGSYEPSNSSSEAGGELLEPESQAAPQVAA